MATKEALCRSTRRRKKGRKWPRVPKERPRNEVVATKKANTARKMKNAIRPITYLSRDREGKGTFWDRVKSF